MRRKGWHFEVQDTGNCRLYYAKNHVLYCIQDETAFGRPSFKFYVCSDDGEPEREVASPFADLAAEWALHYVKG